MGTIRSRRTGLNGPGKSKWCGIQHVGSSVGKGSRPRRKGLLRASLITEIPQRVGLIFGLNGCRDAPPLPKNEAERILEVLEGMGRTPLGEAKRGALRVSRRSAISTFLGRGLKFRCLSFRRPKRSVFPRLYRPASRRTHELPVPRTAHLQRPTRHELDRDPSILPRTAKAFSRFSAHGKIVDGHW